MHADAGDDCMLLYVGNGIVPDSARSISVRGASSRARFLGHAEAARTRLDACQIGVLANKIGIGI